MAYALLPLAYKNALLDAITGRTGITVAGGALANASVNLITYASAFNGTGTPLNASAAMSGADWGSPVAGTAALSKIITPNATGTVVWARFSLAAAGYGSIDGTVTLTGNGGMLIVPSLSFVSGTPVNVTATLRCPLNNGGTLRVNEALANAILTNMIAGTSVSLCGSGATISVYNGTQPATADTAITTQTLLYSYSVTSSTTFAAASGGSVNLSAAIAPVANATANGTGTWFRFQRSSYVLDGSFGTTGTDLTGSSTTFSTGSTVPSLTGLQLTLP